MSDYDVEENENVNYNPSAYNAFWQAAGRSGPLFLLIVVAPLVLVGLVVFAVYAFTHGEAFKASTAGYIDLTWHGIVVLGGIAIASFGLRVILKSLLGWAGVRIQSAEADIREAQADTQKRQARVMQLDGAVAIFHEDGEVEVIPLSREEHKYMHKVLPEPNVVDGDMPPLTGPSSHVALLSAPALEDCLNLAPDFRPHADTVLSGRGAVLGVSGSGKSNTIATLSEELGRLEVPFILADTEDEYQSLCDPRYLPFGRRMDARKVTVDNAESFGRYVLDNGWQVILNLQSYPPDAAAFVMANIIAGMRKWQEERESGDRLSSMLILDEAAHWLPQQTRESQLSDEALVAMQQAFFDDLVRRGRKRGLGVTLATQRSAEIDKRALQSNWKVLHRQTEEADLKRYEAMGLSKEETLSLHDGEAFIFNAQVSKKRVQLRRRHSEHGADTPGLASVRKHRAPRGNFGNDCRKTDPDDTENESTRNLFVRPMEPISPLSEISEPTRPHAGEQQISEISDVSDEGKGHTYHDVPETIRAAILQRRKKGMKRVDIRDDISLNGDEYWMVRVVCDAHDKSKVAS